MKHHAKVFQHCLEKLCHKCTAESIYTCYAQNLNLSVHKKTKLLNSERNGLFGIDFRRNAFIISATLNRLAEKPNQNEMVRWGHRYCCANC